MLLRRTLLALASVLCGCGSYIGSGPAPSVGVARALSVEINVEGDEKSTVEEALRWVLAANPRVRRVKSGGDAIVTLGGKLSQDRAILAGTDCSWRVRLRTVAAGGDELVKEDREWKVEGLPSNVPYETEKLITQGVVWALERTAGGLTSPPAAAQSPAAPAPAQAVDPPVVDTESPPLQPAPSRKKSRPRRR